ncbi:MAG: hypothetical protein WBC48_04585 [Minisyncoccales bacterium]
MRLNFIKFGKFEFLSATAYLSLALLFAYFYRYQWNTDGLAYLSIAQKYASGNFWPAVNGFWSPLYSWLIAIFIALGIPAMAAAKIVGILAGLGLLIASNKLLECFDLAGRAKKMIIAALVPIAVYFSVSLTTPDLLVAAIIIYYLSLVFQSNYTAKNLGILCGVLGGLAYLAKTYAFLFFAVHFAVFSAIFFWQAKSTQEKKDIVRNFIAGTMAFAIIGGVWAALISAKYGEFTIGRTGTYNLAAYGPGAAGDPLDYLGFLSPADKYSLSAWDDPGLIAIPPVQEAAFGENIRHYALNAIANAGKAFIGIYGRFSLLALAAFIVSTAMIIKCGVRKIFARDYAYPSATILILTAGYLPIHIEERYIWVAQILLLLLAAKIIDGFGWLKQNPKLKNIILFFAIFSFTLIPIYKLMSRADTGHGGWQTYSQLNDSGISGKIASNGKWPDSLLLAFYARGQYYGTPKPGIDTGELQKQLKELGIQYYLFWGNGDLPEFLEGKNDLSQGRVAGLKVYYLQR